MPKEPSEKNKPENGIEAIAVEEGVTGLDAYMRRLGFDMASSNMRHRDIRVFSAARKLEERIKKLKIPIAENPSPSGIKQMVEQEVEETVEHTKYKDGNKPTSIPSEQMDISMVTGMEDMPDLIATEWLTEEVAPDLFYKRLTQRELLKKQWQEPTKNPIVSHETIIKKELVEQDAPPEESKQHAYVLLDVSGSMGEEERYIIGQALTVAFLGHGMDQGAQTAMRPFGGGVHGLLRGRNKEEFKEIIEMVLNLRFEDGSTNIQYALQRAVADIEKKGDFTRADILLITDGLSSVDENPLGKIRLHTYVIGDTDYDRDIERWSESFERLRQGEYQNLLDVTDEDIKEIEQATLGLEKDIEELKEGWNEKAVGDKLERLQEVAEKLYQATTSRSKEEKLKSLREKLEQLKASYAQQASEDAKRREREKLERINKEREEIRQMKEKMKKLMEIEDGDKPENKSTSISENKDKEVVHEDFSADQEAMDPDAMADLRDKMKKIDEEAKGEEPLFEADPEMQEAGQGIGNEEVDALRDQELIEKLRQKLEDLNVDQSRGEVGEQTDGEKETEKAEQKEKMDKMKEKIDAINNQGQDQSQSPSASQTGNNSQDNNLRSGRGWWNRVGQWWRDIWKR